MMSERKVCTKEQPSNWRDNDGSQWQHPDARDAGDGNDSCGEYDAYECPHCGLYFKVTVPD